MSINPANLFKARQYTSEIILTAVRWYLQDPLTCEHVSELLTERGVPVGTNSLWR